jgi:flap endonuclease-1
MGLDGFLQFVRKKYPEVLLEEHISLFANKVVFLDISSYIYKYICIYGNTNSQWISSMLQMFLTLRANKVNIIPVFDGKPPDAKKDEINERKEKRQKIKNKMKQLQDIVEKISLKVSLEDEEIELANEAIKKIKDKEGTTKLKNLLAMANINSNQSNSSITYKQTFTEDDSNMIQQYILMIKKQMVYIGDSDTQHLKNLLDILGIPFVCAPEEAEAYCCYMLKQEIGSAVISCDTDCFAHGAKRVILSFEVQSGEIKFINLEDLLEAMELTYEEFVDFAILIGCDYNKKNKLPKVGPVKALELIKNYKSIDNIEGYDISILKHEDIRKLFNPIYKKIKKLRNKDIDEEALFSFIDEHNLRVNRNKVSETIKIIHKKPEINFID